MVDSHSDSSDRPAQRLVPAVGLTLILVAFAGLLVGASVVGATTAPAHETAATVDAAPAIQESNVTEEAFVEPAPEEGDPYFEAVADDGRWISYMNPRDEYREPSLGNGSGKLCVTLLNEEGEVIVGETVPNTTVTIPTGNETSWHSQADPFVVDFPLTEHYTRPLDSDQFGANPDLPQGDGYMDAHCLEWHGLPEDETVEYGEPQIEGEHADDIEVAGYVQKARDTWETDIDPFAEATGYDEAGGWTYEPGGSHGQAVVLLQLEGGVDEFQSPSEDASTADDDGSGFLGSGSGPGWLGIGALAAFLALAVTAVAWRRQ